MKYAFLAISFFAQIMATAQQSAKQLWKQQLGSTPQWMFHAGGTLIVATNERLIAPVDSAYADTLQTTVLRGIDESTGNTKWTYKPSVPIVIPSVEAVPDLPYVAVKDGPFTIIDPTDGRIISDLQLFTKVFRMGYLHKSGHLWIDGIIGNERDLSMIELSTGKRLWTKSDYFISPPKAPKKTNSLTKFLPPEKDNSTQVGLLCNPIVQGDDLIIAVGDRATFNDIYRISIIDGQLRWKAAGPLVRPANILTTDSLFFNIVGSTRWFLFEREDGLTAYDPDNGSMKWKAQAKIKGRVNEIIYGAESMIVSTLVNEAATIIPTGHFYFLDDYDGRLRRELSYPLKGQLRNVSITPHGVFYATDKSVSIIDKNRKDLISVPGHCYTADAGNKAYSYCKADHNLYEINKEEQTATIITKQPINFKGIDSPDRIELRKDGVIVFSDQTVMFINFDGTVRYDVHHAAASEFKTDFFKTLESKTRVSNLAIDSNVIVMITSIGDHTALAIVDKDTGETINVDLPSNETRPMFDVDTTTGRAFYFDSRAGSILAFDINKQ